MASSNAPVSPSVEAPHALTTATVFTALAVGKTGLTTDQARQRIQQHGPNVLQEAPGIPRWRKFLGQFKELVIWILIVAAVVAGIVGEWPDTIAILAIVVLNALIGFFQEERAEQAIAALQKLSAPTAKAMRGGHVIQIPARELVPGDHVVIEAGDNIPADVRLVTTFRFGVQEAALTGESVPVNKDADTVFTADAPLGDRQNMAYMGTVAATGKATGIVVRTGMETQLGHIAGLLQRYQPDPTPLQRRLAELGRVLVFVCLGIVAVIFALEMFRGGEFLEVLLVSISLAVAAVPEGLPAVVTIALALGLQRMVRRNALIRTLPSVETLGSVTVICTDKTGTLTRNEMTVRELYVNDQIYHVTGAGYTPAGTFEQTDSGSTDKSTTTIDPHSVPDLMQLLTIGTRCNGAQLAADSDQENVWQVIGDPTEGALIVVALKAHIPANDGDQHVLFEIPFDSDRKMMSVALREDDQEPTLYVKGAPEVVLSRCMTELRDGAIGKLTEERRAAIMQANSAMAARALRVLGFAYRRDVNTHDVAVNESELIFAGLMGMIDPPRDEARVAVRKCQTAGIRPIMITGDHPETALAIARELHIAAPEDTVVSGSELDRLDDDQLREIVPRAPVYARVSAEHKLRVDRGWKERGDVAAMTGDGVNDAPAVKAADIGIAMGITGTHVTKEASDMVLMDDNFESIVNAVEEGRG
ncbi:MAG: HAD-IC family P-type ATPase, partial [Planctomycetales bacterium]|nr:HAD-IC family P-type ATPase [Planctomycetales bacterium]